MEFLLAELCEQVMTANAARRPVFIRGGGTKSFYGASRLHAEPDSHAVLDVSNYAGVVHYEPSELALTARAGTLLSDIERTLDEQGQMLAFEPPRFGAASTLGGCVAAGLSGPRRMTAGPLRDYVLGTRLLDSSGSVLRFGGEVMKNVAGYDVSRLLAGSMGIFGLVLEVSLRVVPKPLREATLVFEMPQVEALERFGVWRGRPLPISATAWVAQGAASGRLWVRLSGNDAAVVQAISQLGGQVAEDSLACAFWRSLRDQTHESFSGRPLWRVAVPPGTPPLAHGATRLMEWSGGQRWLSDVDSGAALRQSAQQAAGHATLYRYETAAPDVPVFHPLPSALLAISQRLKRELDPAGIFNPKRLFPDF